MSSNSTMNSDAADRTQKVFAHIQDNRFAKPAKPGSGLGLTSGNLGPEFWADAPWRVEPDTRMVPFTFFVRDFVGSLNEIRIEERRNGRWEEVHKIANLGAIPSGPLWVHREQLPIDPTFKTAQRGNKFLLKAVFDGVWREANLGRGVTHEQCLEIYWAKESLPLHGSDKWHYGDTHYHSDYTNDIREFGAPIRDTRDAAICIGLDWVVITDHSCDLESENPYFSKSLKDPQNRWEAMRKDVDDCSDSSFRVVQGIEATVKGASGPGDDTLHMLVFGSKSKENGYKMGHQIPGAWASPNILNTIVAKLASYMTDAIGYLFGRIYDLGEVLTGLDTNNTLIPKLEECSVTKQQALAFAAHPVTPAQGPCGVWEDQDLHHPELTGMQAWNSRHRFRDGDQKCQFTAEERNRHSSVRSKTLKGIAKWDDMLVWSVNNRQNPRCVLIAGSDAHGSFSHSVAWGIDWDGILAEDNALGKVRTALYLHSRQEDNFDAPSNQEIVDAISKGSCVATDGPILNLTATSGGADAGKAAPMGTVMDIGGDAEIEMQVAQYSTAEFGDVESVSVVYYSKGLVASNKEQLDWDGGKGILNLNAKSNAGYIRLEAETESNGDTFRCYTNPIWFKGDTDRPLKITVAWADS